MEDAAKASSDVPLVKDAHEDPKTDDVSVKDVSGLTTKEENKVMVKEEEDTICDSGFIKVEKEGIVSKDDVEPKKQVPIEISSSNSPKELQESQEKAKELELALKKVTRELSWYKNDHSLLKDELENSQSCLLKTEQKVSSQEALIQELEKKKKGSEETDALMSQALSNNSDLEKKLEESSKEVSELKSALLVAEEEEKKSNSSIEVYQEKVTNLDSSLNQSSARISELEEDLRIALQKGAEHEDLGNVSTQRSVELEALLRVLSSELDLARGKLESLGNDMKASVSREGEAMEKLKSAKERLVKQAGERDEAIARNIELEALHKHSELTRQKSMEDIRIIDSKAKSLAEKSKDLEVKIILYEEKLAKATTHSIALKEALDLSSTENELLADTNSQLKIKIQELEGFLDSEKETAVRQAEETKEKFNKRDIEAKELVTKVKSHESLIEEHKKQVLEVSGLADTRKMELEEALSKLKTFEATIKDLEKENGSLAEVNLKLNQELANHGSETDDFQEMFSAVEAEKDQTKKELQASIKTIEKLTNEFTLEGERLKSKISSLGEENNQVNEIYMSTKDELVKLQEQLQVEKSKSDAMVSEIKKLNVVASEKSVLVLTFEEKEKQLKDVEARLKEEVEKVKDLTAKMQEHEQKASDRDSLDKQAIQLHKELQDSYTVISAEKEAVSLKLSELEWTIKKSQEELEAKKSMIVHLESELKELEEKVHLADVKSRDIDLTFSTSKQVMSKKETEDASSLSSSGHVTIQKGVTSNLMTLKIVLGVALVSIILGVMLGKKF